MNAATGSAARITAAQIAQAAQIAPRTTTFVLRDHDGAAYPGNRAEHVLAALQRGDRTPDLPAGARTAALGLYKCFTTGRMDVQLARRVREQYSPYQLCALVARIATDTGPAATTGYLADDWINQHATDL
jgi:hypothetical protein